MTFASQKQKAKILRKIDGLDNKVAKMELAVQEKTKRIYRKREDLEQKALDLVTLAEWPFGVALFNMFKDGGWRSWAVGDMQKNASWHLGYKALVSFDVDYSAANGYDVCEMICDPKDHDTERFVFGASGFDDSYQVRLVKLDLPRTKRILAQIIKNTYDLEKVQQKRAKPNQ